MNIREVFCIAFHNIRGRQKIGKLLFFILFLALFIYFLINSMAFSIDKAVQLMDETPTARNIIYQDRDGNLYAQLKELSISMKHILDIYPYVYEIATDVEGIKKEERVSLSVKSCSDNYKDYLVKGTLPEKNEILLPHYMYAAENGNYVDGSKYIGETLKLYITNRLDNEIEFECTVSGTYDNIYAVTGTTIAFLNTEDAVFLSEKRKEGSEEQLRKDMEVSGDYDRSHYIGYEMEYYYAVILDSRENLDKVRYEIAEKIDVSGFTECNTEGGLPTIFSFIQFIGMILTIILLITVIIMMIIMIGNDIGGRKKEIAIYIVQGYTRKNLVCIFEMEYAIRLIPVLFVSFIVVMITLMLENLGIQNLLPMEYGII
ncbi:MAG: ABC transporter permease, partial [Lachnospiraceae bacterium]|nr:ABC transporter permease [Lachnospiraceae bacterium]